MTGFLIRTIDLTADGREIVRERAVEGDALTIGRASENAIHLPDLAVEQQHARLEAEGDRLRAIAVGTLGFTLDGRSVTSASFDPREGAELGFGSYRLDIAQDGDGPVAITQRQVADTPGSGDALKGFALGSALPSKRVMSWALLATILLAFLAVPIWTHLSRDPARPDADRTGQVAMDASWSTGSLSLAHHGLEDSCEACHVEPFVAVRDETCLTCHEGIGDHAKVDRQLVSRGPLSTGEALQLALATTLGKEGPGSCTTCHTEHEGATRMEPPAQQFCADCHNGMDARLTDTVLGNAADFGTSHPQFHALLTTRPNQAKPQRLSLDKPLREYNGLRFPHKLHLDARGGVARMAGNLRGGKGYGNALVCADCHTPTADDAAFLPVDMEEDCEACHSLVYDKVGSTFRSLDHGNVDRMLADLRAMDRAPRQPIVTGRRRPGQYAQGERYYQNFGRPAGSLVGINRALSRDGVCGECHIPTTKNGRPAVMPVTVQDVFFVHSRFDHKPHRQEKCSTCHEADISTSSSDLLIPGIALCRDCHLGEDARQAEVPSTCAMCHSYHPKKSKMPADHPERPEQVARVVRRPG